MLIIALVIAVIIVATIVFLAAAVVNGYGSGSCLNTNAVVSSVRDRHQEGVKVVPTSRESGRNRGEGKPTNTRENMTVAR